MQIYTSYFGNIKNIDTSKYQIVSISLYPPKWFEGKVYKKLAPTKEILMDWKAGNKDQEAMEHYERAFNFKVLRKLDLDEVIKDLEELSDGKDIVLLCFEKPNDFCHRHLFANYLRDKKGILVKEL